MNRIDLDSIDINREALLKKKREIRIDRIKDSLAGNLKSSTKQLIWLFSINGILWIWCSYVLAFMDKLQIAETLSSNVCTIVIGQMGMYLVTKTVENVFRYNEKLGGRSTYTYDNVEVVTPPVSPIDNTVINNESEVNSNGREEDSGSSTVDPSSLV